jgi:hypothetical protein
VNYNTKKPTVNTPCHQSWFKPRRSGFPRVTMIGSSGGQKLRERMNEPCRDAVVHSVARCHSAAKHAEWCVQ